MGRRWSGFSRGEGSRLRSVAEHANGGSRLHARGFGKATRLQGKMAWSARLICHARGMPRTCVFDTEKEVIYVEASGVFTEAEFRLGAANTVRDPRFRPDMRTLVDFTRVTQFKISAA